ncbi:MAG: ATP-binding cassette domain-containing protein [Bacteriovoracaceae bacterium]
MLVVKDLALLTGKKVNLTLEKGQRYVLQGPNGSGKTVLLRTLAGLYPTTYTEFVFEGKKLDDWIMEDYRSQVLYTGTTTHLPGEMSSEEFLAAPFKLTVYQDMNPSLAVEEYLSRWKLAGKKLSHLSSGQKQLLIILRSLSLHPRLLLLDEPTSHMDPDRTKEVEELLLKWQTPEKSYLMISHSEKQAASMGKMIRFNELILE